MVFAAAVNRGLGSRTGAGRVSRELPTEPWPPRALKPPFSRSREKGRFHHGLLAAGRKEKEPSEFAWLCWVEKNYVIFTSVSCASFLFPKHRGRKSHQAQCFPGRL